jgi:hypothetical protein
MSAPLLPLEALEEEQAPPPTQELAPQPIIRDDGFIDVSPYFDTSQVRDDERNKQLMFYNQIREILQRFSRSPRRLFGLHP